MKLSETEYKECIKQIYNDDIQVVGEYLGLSRPILVKDKYGEMYSKKANLVLHYRPSILIALNKTKYVMNMLKDKQPLIYNNVECVEEYKTMKSPTLFKTQFGLIKTTFDTMFAGHMPDIRSAVDKCDYFKKQLLFLYDNKYDFKITNSNRHGGKSILICPVHGEVVIDNDYIFVGKGCPLCHNTIPSTVFYFIRITFKDFFCYKIGISYRQKDNTIRRYTDYRKKGYSIDVIKEIDFDDHLQLKQYELGLKKLIKHDLVTPLLWDAEMATECFTEKSFDIV